MRGVGGVMALIGLGILIGTAVPLSQELKKPAKDQSPGRKTGLGFGIAIGAFMLLGGIYMLVTGAGGSVGSSNSKNVSKEAAEAAALVSQNPLNIAANAAEATEQSAAVAAENAINLKNKAAGAKHKLEELKGVFASMKK
jgi:hypothetical protein